MTQQLIISPSTSLAEPLPIERTEEARAFQSEALARSTKRNYGIYIEAWHAYCAGEGIAPYPVRAVALANWLASRAESGPRAGRRHGSGEGQALGTLKLAYTAVRVANRAQGHRFDDDGGVVRATLNGIRRVAGSDQGQVKALRGRLIVAIIERLDPADPLACRDAALLATGYIFARRRSELVALDWRRRGDGDGHVEIDAMQARAILAKHKTAMKEGSITITVPRATNRLALAAIERWVSIAGIAPGSPLLRRVRKQGQVGTGRLTAAAVAYIIKRRIYEHLRADGVPHELAVEESELYSGHSLRHGFATTAAEAGADMRAIRNITKHRGDRELNRYIAQADAMLVTAHNSPGVGIGGED